MRRQIKLPKYNENKADKLMSKLIKSKEKVKKEEGKNPKNLGYLIQCLN